MLKIRNFRALFFSGLFSTVADWMLLATLPYYIYTQQGSAFATSLMFAFYAASRLIFGLIAGVISDRFYRPMVMAASSGLMSVVIPLLLLAQNVNLFWVIYVVSFVQAALARFFIPAKYSTIPDSVSGSDLVAANSLDSATSGITRMIGPLIGGGLFAVVGLPALVVTVAVLYVASTLLALRVSVPRTERTPRSRGGVGSMVRDLGNGIPYLWQNLVLRTIALMDMMVMLGYGFISVLLVLFATEVQTGNAALYGTLIASQGVGMAAGSLLVGIIGSRARRTVLLSSGLIGAGAFFLAAFYAPSTPVAALFLGLAGMGTTVWMVGERTVLQATIAEPMRGRVFGLYSTLSSILMLAGSTLSGVMASHLGVMTLLTVAALLYLIPGLLSAWLLARRADGETPAVS